MSEELENSYVEKSISRDDVVNTCNQSGMFKETERGFEIVVWNATSDLALEEDVAQEPLELVANDLPEKFRLLGKVAGSDQSNYLLIELGNEKAVWVKY
jgi:hypothetical protein